MSGACQASVNVKRKLESCPGVVIELAEKCQGGVREMLSRCHHAREVSDHVREIPGYIRVFS